MNKYGANANGRGNSQDKKCTLQVIGFPCNQFGYQEPAENAELMNCIKYVRPGFGFEPNFPLMGKIEVNGHGESPIFTFLKARCPPPMGLIANRTDITWTPIRSNDLSWNFSKFLTDHEGNPVMRYTPRTTPKEIEEDIRKLLEDCKREQEKSNGVSTGNSTVGTGSVNATMKPQLQQAAPPHSIKKKRSFMHIFN